MDPHAKNFRETLGVVVAAIVVLCFIGLGFVQVGIFLITGTSITFDSDWKISIYGLANIAFGYLIGAKLAGTQPNGAIQSPVVENAESVTVQSQPPVATRNPSLPK